jgi:hypothetical protein
VALVSRFLPVSWTSGGRSLVGWFEKYRTRDDAPDMTMGAIAGERVDDDVVHAFDVEPETVKEIADREGAADGLPGIHHDDHSWALGHPYRSGCFLSVR